MRWLYLSILVILSACRTSSGIISPGPADTGEVIRVLDTPVDFEGSRSTSLSKAALSEIRIGYFGPADETDRVGGPMFRAATLAIEEANTEGGYRGIPLRLVSRWDADPWRGGSREVAHLVYPDSVCAVIGSINGESTHLAEQITHKLWVPLLSPVSADPTLTYINVPWIFRLPPDEEVQARLLFEEVIEVQTLRRLGLITSTNHDGRVFAEEMMQRLEERGVAPLFHLQINANESDADEVAARTKAFDPDGLIIRLPVPDIKPLLEALRGLHIDVPVLLPWIPGLEKVDLREWSIYAVQPFAPPDTERYREFEERYRTRFGDDPPPAAALTYDAARMLLAALTESGPDGIALRKAIWERSGYQGITGLIRWDNGGGNIGEPVIVTTERVNKR